MNNTYTRSSRVRIAHNRPIIPDPARKAFFADISGGNFENNSGSLVLRWRKTDAVFAKKQHHGYECGAFVVSGAYRVFNFPTLESAEQRAHEYAEKHHGRNFYTGYVGSDLRTHSRWQWDKEEKRVIRFACND